MTSSSTERWLYLSPHLDDAALSCGGHISQTTHAGHAVEILTLFAGDEPGPEAPPVSPLVSRIFELWGLEAGEVMATRRREDFAAGATLGAEIAHWELQEAIHRRHPTRGEALYPTLEKLFGPIASEEEAIVAALAARIVIHARESGATFIVAPLGVGGHVDHRIVRAAAERALGDALYYYEEFPYVVWKLWALRRAGIYGRRWERRSLPLRAEDLAARVAAIACYASQVTPLFRHPDRIDLLVRRHARRAGGERLWRRASARPREWPRG